MLEENGRAHLSGEVYKCWDWIRAAGFPNVNIDLIAGMVGETWDNWKENIAKTIALDPDSVTIYQMELPFNTVYSKDILGNQIETPVADWPTKRAWVEYAYDEMQAAGYSVSSAYTLVKDKNKINFSYRDNLWHGSDLLATGVASFGHASGVHYQNQPDWAGYVGALDRGELPLSRGMRPTPHQLLVREMILQLKTGRLDADYFRQQVRQPNIVDQWRDVWQDYQAEGYLTVSGDDDRLDPGRPAARRRAAAGLLRARASRGPLYMSDELVFMMGQFTARFPTDRLYAKNPMWALPRRNHRLYNSTER